LLAAVGTMVINQFVADAGIRLGMTPSLLVLGIGLSVLMGTCGGLYPAWRAARLLPMEAIRLGSH
jgi:putative ABC transport system permease protein